MELFFCILKYQGHKINSLRCSYLKSLLNDKLATELGFKKCQTNVSKIFQQMVFENVEQMFSKYWANM
jgi:hypothetical protein